MSEVGESSQIFVEPGKLCLWNEWCDLPSCADFFPTETVITHARVSQSSPPE